jgi:purine catabolism regulator
MPDRQSVADAVPVWQHATMPATVAALVADPTLSLRLLVDGPSSAAPIEWVHSSDLADPTPFLASGQMLLTTGRQFLGAGGDGAGGDPRDGVPPGDDPAVYEAYVARLAAAGIRSIGFGTDVVRSGTPEQLALACERHGLALVEVPYRTPFIAVIRRAADAIAHDAHARDEWSLRAQRAVSLAALGSGGVAAALRALSQQLDRTVLLFDSAGSATTSVLGSRVSDPGAVAAEAARMLRHGTRASSAIVLDDGSVAGLQTFGRRGELRGVLAVAGAAPLDSAETAVVTAAVALTEVALETSRPLRAGMRALREQLVALLLDGRVDAVRAVSAALGGELPEEPVVLLRVAPGADAQRVEEALARLSPALFGGWGDDLVAVLPASRADEGERLAAQFRLAAGLSRPVDYAALRAGIDEAGAALARASAGELVRSAGAGSVSELLAERAAQQLAAERLGPLLAADDGRELLAAAAVWLRHNGMWDPAARELGLHRHSLKARIERVGRALDLDLAGFEGRVELWALLAARPSPFAG